MTLPTDYEQLLLEYVNALRSDPALAVDQVLNGGTRSERQAIDQALSYFNVDRDGFLRQMQDLPSQAPLAWNGHLAQAAEGHSDKMIAQDRQGHLLAGEEGLGTRVVEAGYTGWNRVGENVYAYGESMLHTHAGFVIDWGYDAQDYDAQGRLRSDWRNFGDGLQDPAGHRELLLSDRYSEIGISVLEDSDPRTSVGPFVVTQNFGQRKAYEAQLMGVVISDLDQDRFYDIGEGMAGVTVTAQSQAGVFSTTTWASGGYQMVLAPGLYQLTFSGGGLQGQITQMITMTEANQKSDAFADQAVTPPAPSLPDPAPLAPEAPRDHGLPYGSGLSLDVGDLILEGASGGQLLQGHLGNDMLYGEGIGTPQRLAAQWNASPEAPEVMGQVYRLYKATLGRGPDLEGQINWTKVLLEGSRTLEQVVTGFTGSKEFRSLYGDLGDAAFVTLLYNNVLGRAPDAGGLASWTKGLQDGLSREKVVLGFANSQEFITLTNPIVKDLAANSDPATWSGAVYRLYEAAFDRAPDVKGFLNWTKHLAGGMSTERLGSGFANSVEFKNRYGDLDNEGFVYQLYANILDRKPDAGGLQTWLGVLEAGFSRGHVLWKFAQGAEFSKSIAPDLKDWMRALGGDDTLIGGGGDDQFFGGMGSDTFVFHAQGEGQKLIHDFEPWDYVALQGFGYQDFSDVSAHLRQNGADVIFEDQGLAITFRDTGLATLSSDVFLI